MTESTRAREIQDEHMRDVEQNVVILEQETGAGKAMSDEKDIVYWDAEDSEELIHDSRHDAIEMALDSLAFADNGKLPRTLEVKAFARMPIDTDMWGDSIAETLVEQLDEEFGGPDSDFTEVTDFMKEAGRTFARAVVSKYTPWLCYVVSTETVDVPAWVKENAPDWKVTYE